MKKYGLGKGLGALIPEEDNSEQDKSVVKIPINLIKANEKQPREDFDQEKILELAKSIKEHGIIQPLILKEEDDIYTIVAGERRWRAAKLLGLKEVPVVIMDLSDKEILEVSLIENIQREDLNSIEEAKAYKKLIEEFCLTQDELSNRLGKSRTALANCMRLLNLDSRVQDYIINGFIKEGHGRALLGINSNEVQYELAQEVINKKLSVRQTEKLVKEYLNNNKEKKETADNVDSNEIYYNDIGEKLEMFFGTKVNVKHKKNKGKIEIEYYSNEELQRILDILEI